MMTFKEWYSEITAHKQSDNRRWLAEAAWEAGIQEGINRMYTIYDMCPECKLLNSQHKMDCGKNGNLFY